MNPFVSNREYKLTLIGFIILIVGGLALPRELHFQIPFAIGSVVCFVLALYFVIREEKPITSLE